MTDSNLKILNRHTMLDLIGDDSVMIHKFQTHFLEQATESLKKIIVFYHDEAFAEIKEQAHFLKTSAAAVGAEQSVHLLVLLEKSAEIKNKLQCSTLIENIEKALILVREEVTLYGESGGKCDF
ncbi:Hpt domain-containing protein [Shewanella sp. VB17]|uniref:Hpt domain-containing protein n=1 Tax=Shewanella sp. VB17 TaxID=2739432 RepID=UPI0015640B0B|nr:Hpt domain-containing protein [Shewanella sp. VB17]NRD75722.1 Hpt domain-containing protein [Shewanella sp. VB17]